MLRCDGLFSVATFSIFSSMNRKIFLCATTAIATAALSGCQNIQWVTQSQTLDEANILDRVHVRDEAVLYQASTLAGAAIRENEEAHVLFNKHHFGLPVKNMNRKEHPSLKNMEGQKLLSIVVAEPVESDRKSAEESSTIKKAKEPTSKRSSEQNLKDKSIYSNKTPRK